MEIVRNYAADLQSLVGILEGVLVHSARVNPPSYQGMELKHGQEKYFPDLRGWKVRRKLKSEIVSDNEYELSCTHAAAEELRLSFLINNLPALPDAELIPGLEYLRKWGAEPVTTVDEARAYPWLRAPEIPYHPRYQCRSLQEAWEIAQNLSPVRLRGPAGWWEYPPDLMSAAILMCEAIMANPDLRYQDVFALLKDSLECAKIRPATCRHLVMLYSFDVIKGGFNLGDERRHLQLPDGNPRHRLRVLYEFMDFFGNFPPYRIGDAQVHDFITYVVKRRQEENPGDKVLDRDTIMKNMEPISGMFELAAHRGVLLGNPFYRHAKKIKSRFYRPDKKPTPHSIAQLRCLLRTAWEIDKQMCFALVIGIFTGLRKGEMIDSFNFCLNLGRRVITVTDDAAKENTPSRPVYLTDVAFMWISLFELGSPGERLLGGDINTGNVKGYSDRLLAIRELTIEHLIASGEGEGLHWNKDKMRKNFSINMQWIGVPLEFQKLALGHSPETNTTKLFYHGSASPEWAEAFLQLTPESVLGFIPEKVPLQDRLACNLRPVPKKSKKPKTEKQNETK